MGKPLPGVEDALDELYGRGYSIVVYTLMARTESGKEAVAEWLDHYGIDYADVTAIKPDALVYIDNRAIRHTDWMSTMQQVNGITGYVDEY